VLSKDESSVSVEWNAKFKDRMDFYGVTIRLCRYYRAQTNHQATLETSAAGARASPVFLERGEEGARACMQRVGEAEDESGGQRT
jgi:hypothetical protein